MKKTTYFIVIGILVFIFALISIYYNYNKKPAPAPTEKPIISTGSDLPTTLAGILTYNSPLFCSFANHEILRKPSGNVYKNGTNIRTDILALNNESIFKTSHSITVDGISYLWYEGDSIGMKQNLNLAREKAAKQATSSQSTKYEDNSYLDAGLYHDTEYSCKEWVVDQSVFSIPTEVEFLDIDKFYDELSKELCNRCDQESSEQTKNLCKITLKCNQ